MSDTRLSPVELITALYEVANICKDNSSKLKAKYKLAVVEEVVTSGDGKVRSGTLKYVLMDGTNVSRVVRVKRSVQRLVLLLPVEEQCAPLQVVDDGHTLVSRVTHSNL